MMNPLDVYRAMVKPEPLMASRLGDRARFIVGNWSQLLEISLTTMLILDICNSRIIDLCQDDDVIELYSTDEHTKYALHFEIEPDVFVTETFSVPNDLSKSIPDTTFQLIAANIRKDAMILLLTSDVNDATSLMLNRIAAGKEQWV